MVYLLSFGIECFSSLIFVIPAVLLLQHTLFKQHSFRKFIMLLLFALYLAAVFSVTGIPTAGTLKIDFNFNFIPFLDIVNSPAAYIKNTVLNIILFMPLGFLLPAVWKDYRSFKTTVWTGFAVSVMIEVFQIFTFRATDIDDLITNTLGAILGYYISKLFSFKLPLDILESDRAASKKREPVIILTAVLLIKFFLQSLVSNALWNIVLSGSLWERIK